MHYHYVREHIITGDIDLQHIVVHFRVRVNDNDDNENEDRNGGCDDVGNDSYCGVMARLINIAGWGVVPRMAPPASQGGST